MRCFLASAITAVVAVLMLASQVVPAQALTAAGPCRIVYGVPVCPKAPPAVLYLTEDQAKMFEFIEQLSETNKKLLEEETKKEK